MKHPLHIRHCASIDKNTVVVFHSVYLMTESDRRTCVWLFPAAMVFMVRYYYSLYIKAMDKKALPNSFLDYFNFVLYNLLGK